MTCGHGLCARMPSSCVAPTRPHSMLFVVSMWCACAACAVLRLLRVCVIVFGGRLMVAVASALCCVASAAHP